MVYTLSTPTIIAGDAATHPYAGQLLAALSAVFRLTEQGVTALGMCALDADPDATARAWDLAEYADASALTTAHALRTVSVGGRRGASEELSRARFGHVGDVARLVVAEAGRWPDRARVAVPGAGLSPGSAAAAAAVVAGWWVRPHLAAAPFEVLTEPWHAALRSQEGALVEAADLYGPRGGYVVDVQDRVGAKALTLDALASVRWAPGVWAAAMHSAAWAAFATGRLHSQLLAVVDVTSALVHAHPTAGAFALRSALPALHALTVAELMGDVLGDEPLAVLRLADGRG
ncbi:hypothetical protein [Pengzhenrongella frigida]|uniref:Uncharacterized protein n=1 Tax=Pengzhenrongella frigida TaxID=1259133 RepID=A0A4Q5N376_9MICO|nr:hypothetical protein [Cellulomonas sp. HLT2-17]RYV52630.1 hypothetical protein EUA98_02740 [Cellulomonas sp. HLT2-17]